MSQKGLLNAINKLASDDLLKNLKRFRGNEATSLADIILYLYEIDTRKLYTELGYSSLFVFCVEALKYSEGSAYRRIRVARALKDNPEIYFLIKKGKLSLCAVTEISKVSETESKNKLISVSQGKTKEEVKLLTAAYLPPEPAKKDRITPVKVENVETNAHITTDMQAANTTSEVKFTFTVEVNNDFMSLYNKAKAYIGFCPPSEILRKALEEYVNKREKPTNRKVKASEDNNNRYIPGNIKKEIFKRDNYQCTFIASDGRRCTEKHLLQIDHIKPYGLGGNNSTENLRLMCPAHNRLLAEKTFGKAKMESYVV